MSTENVELVREWYEDVFNRRRTEAIEERLDDDSVCLADVGELRGPAGFRQLQFEPFITAFPDLRVTIDGIVGTGDEVVVRWSAHGTHTGTALGLVPTGRQVRFTGVSWIRINDGKFRQGWQWTDIPAVLATLR